MNEQYKLVLNDLRKFYKLIVNCFSNELIKAPHIDFLSMELMKFYRNDDYHKLSISLPPRHGKSTLITLAFPIWLILRNPRANILIITSTFSLAETMGIKIREIFKMYESLFNIRISQKKHASGWLMFEDENGNLTGGTIRLIGLGGQITGLNADYVIADDLVKGVSDTTPTVLDKTKEYFTGVVEQRLEPHSKIVVLGTKWHSDDILGYIRNELPEYKIIDLPAYDTTGKILWPEKFDKEYFDEKESTMGQRLFNALYMCQPLDENGDFFDIDRVKFIDDFKVNNPLIDKAVRSWDFAYSADDPKKDNDYTASCKMYSDIKGNLYVTEITNERLGDNLFNRVKNTARVDGLNCTILMETGTVGGASEMLYKEYRGKLQGYRTMQSKPIGSKVDRAVSLKEAILDGKIFFNLPADQRELLMRQLKGFPVATHDDVVDTLAYGVQYLNKGANSFIGTTRPVDRFRR